MDPKARIVIADDETLLRDYLAVILSSELGLEVVGLARNGEEAVQLVRETAPDIVLLDLQMPVMDGIAAAREMRALQPDIKIAILTGSTDQDSIFAGIEAGADAYLLKTGGREEILAGVRSVVAGDAQVAPAALRHIVDEFRRLREMGAQPGELPPTISNREKEVLRLVCRGMANKEIARELGIGVSTVKSHLNQAFEKLGVEDRTQAALLGAARGWFASQ